MSDCAFDLCDGSGFLYDDATNTAYDCRCRPPAQSPRRKARSLSAVIPRRYRDVAFDRPPVTEIEPPIVVATVRRSPTRSTSSSTPAAACGSWGRSGPARRRWRCWSRRRRSSAGRSVAIYSLPRLLNEIRDTHRAERSHVDLLDRLTAVDLLHIDDVGAERTTDWVLEELYSIVNARYEDQRSMVITTNSSTATRCASRSPSGRSRG